MEKVRSGRGYTGLYPSLYESEKQSYGGRITKRGRSGVVFVGYHLAHFAFGELLYESNYSE